VFSIFWVTVLPSILMNQVLPAFIANRGIFVREFTSGMYSPEVFTVAQLLGEVPCSILCAIIYWVIMIYAQGFGQGSAGLGGTAFQLVVITFVELFGVSLGQFIAAITPSVQVGILFDPFFHGRLDHFLRSNYSVSESCSLLEVVGVSTQPVHTIAKRHAINRASWTADTMQAGRVRCFQPPSRPVLRHMG